MRRKSSIIVTVLGFFLVYSFIGRQLFSADTTKVQRIFRSSNPLDGCKHVYLDVGTNIGVQIRKLFEPNNYEGAKILPYFDAYFGENRADSVCAVGFEPNERLESHLRKLESSFNKCGYRTTIFTRTAVSHQTKTNGAFFFLRGLHNGIGGSIVKIHDVLQESKRSVDLLRLADFIQNKVLTRSIPASLNDNLPPAILMKMDIEGSEATVIPDLILSGVLPSVNLTLIEWHKFNKEFNFLTNVRISNARNMMKYLRRTGRRNDMQQTIEWDELDDESYYDRKDPYPEC